MATLLYLNARLRRTVYISHPDSSWTPEAFYTCCISITTPIVPALKSCYVGLLSGCGKCEVRARERAQEAVKCLLSASLHLQQKACEGKTVGREDSGLWTPRADAGEPRRTGGHACCLLQCSVTQIRLRPPRCFVRVSTTTLIVSALKNYHM